MEKNCNTIIVKDEKAKTFGLIFTIFSEYCDWPIEPPISVLHSSHTVQST